MAEERGFLIANDEACAGPPQLINQALSVLMGELAGAFAGEGLDNLPASDEVDALDGRRRGRSELELLDLR